MASVIVGIDVATDPKKRYISFATINEHKVSLEWVADGNAQPKLVADISQALKRNDRVLLALDAPLGWPVPLAQALANHSAGTSLNYLPDDMFRRSTDRFIKEKINKQSLDVGADRIARTAHAALSLLNEISSSIQTSIPLAWDTSIEKMVAIEVYPAATLIAYGRNASGYKGQDGRTARESILSWLTKTLAVSSELKRLLVSNDNALDSAICVLAGRDFLSGNCYVPSDLGLSKREGWIWVHKKQDQ
jgi:predicted RNase H-like nuclease